MAGVDLTNQFPNSVMAKNIKNGHSLMRSVDAPSVAVGAQNNIPIATASVLTVPANTNYAVVTAVGGALYYTVDGSVPSATNFSGMLAQGSSVPFYGAALLAALRVIGTQMSVEYLR